MTELVSTCEAREVAPAGKVPDLVHLLPAGEIVARDGRSWRLRDPEAVIRASMRGADLVIDYEHQSEDASRRGPDGIVPAAGWITDLVARANGIWGRVVWTARARAHLAAREYRYLSPVIAHAGDGTVLRLKGAGLVHDPALALTALARQEQPMSDLSRIAAALDLAEDAGVEAILTALARQEPDPAKYVPIAAVKDLMAARTELTATMSEREAVARVDRAVLDGHITPGMRGWAISLCRKDPQSFEDFLSGSPAPYKALFQSYDHHFQGKPGAGVHSAEQVAIARELGLTPEQLED